jgi:hypothetical protein
METGGITGKDIPFPFMGKAFGGWCSFYPDFHDSWPIHLICT